jgi:hypothetical protein
MRRCALVPDKTAADVDDPHGIQSLIRVFLPPETSAFTAIGQVPSKTRVDESLFFILLFLHLFVLLGLVIEGPLQLPNFICFVSSHQAIKTSSTASNTID